MLRYLYVGEYSTDPHSDRLWKRSIVGQLSGTQNATSVVPPGRTPEVSGGAQNAFVQADTRLFGLRAHVLVNQVADKFNIETIKDLASEHFATQLDTDDVKVEAFMDLASLVYESTTAADKLRINFTEFCLDNVAKIEENEKLSKSIKAHEPVAYAVGKTLLDRITQLKVIDTHKDEVIREKEEVIKEKDGRIKHLEKRMGSISAFGSPKGLNGFGGTRSGGFGAP